MSENIDLERKLKTFIKQISTYTKAVRKEPVEIVREESAEEEIEIEIDYDEIERYLRETYGETKTGKILRFFGGDWYIKDEIIDLLKKSGKKTLVEVFGGSGIIASHAPRDVFKHIVYNDIDDLLVSFFTVLRERPEELKKKLMLMPLSRSLRKQIFKKIESGEIYKMDPVDKAAYMFFISWSSFMGVMRRDGAGFAIGKEKGLEREYIRKIISLTELAKRFIDVTIENKDFRELIKIYDSEATVFYCDPPHLDPLGKTRDKAYIHGFTEKDFKDLLEILSSIKGAFVLKLPEDHLQIDFIKEWIERNRYNTKIIEHMHSAKKVIGEKRPRIHTILVYNYNI
jgi:DNA adenine methylase